MSHFNALPYAQRMAATTGADIDGTLLDYGHKWQKDNPHLLNHDLCKALAGQVIHLITNQGGLALRTEESTFFPSVPQFLHRLQFLFDGLDAYRITVASLRIATDHPKAQAWAIAVVTQTLTDAFRYQDRTLAVAYDAPFYRKPHPTMLQIAGIKTYYGDSAEDVAAACAAGAIFVRVTRFPASVEPGNGKFPID